MDRRQPVTDQMPSNVVDTVEMVGRLRHFQYLLANLSDVERAIADVADVTANADDNVVSASTMVMVMLD